MGVKIFVLLMVIVAVVSALTLAGCAATRGGYETAPSRVVRSSGSFSVRDYPALTVAQTVMAPDAQGADGSFSRLFGFITGRNDARQKISMTTPVLMSGAGSNRTMAFVMPAKVKTGLAPKPSDGAVTLRELPGGRFAVFRFSGKRSAKNEAKALERLESWMAAEGLSAAGAPVYGYFDPPWTPGFLRRNEVMKPVAAAAGPGA